MSQALWTPDKIHPETALYTGIPVIGDNSRCTGNLNKAVLLSVHIQFKLAADTAVHTGGENLLKILHLAQLCRRFIGHGAYWTDSYTLTTAFTACILQRDVECGGNQNLTRPFSECNGIGPLNFFTDFNTAHTADTFGGVVLNRFVVVGVVGNFYAGFYFWEPVLIHMVAVGIILEETIPICITGGAHHTMFAYHQFQSTFP